MVGVHYRRGMALATIAVASLLPALVTGRASATDGEKPENAGNDPDAKRSSDDSFRWAYGLSGEPTEAPTATDGQFGVALSADEKQQVDRIDGLAAIASQINSALAADPAFGGSWLVPLGTGELVIASNNGASLDAYKRRFTPDALNRLVQLAGRDPLPPDDLVVTYRLVKYSNPKSVVPTTMY